MTAKAEFNAEEWSAVAGAPLLAAMMVIAADRGGSVRESVAVAKAYGEAREQYTSELMSALLASPPATGQRPDSPGDLPEQAKSMLRDAVATLERVASEDEVVEYKRFVYALAESAAGARKEGGFLGIGGGKSPISEAEQAALDEIAAIFDAQPPAAV